MVDIDIDKVMDMIELPAQKVRNIYVYGSQVYGTQHPNSDYDILVTACSMNVHKEYNDGEYNVHTLTPDVFEDRLRSYEMQPLECIFAPEDAQIKITKNYHEDFKVNLNLLKKKALSQSSHCWHQARMRMKDENIEYGAKALWHSLRILAFATDIMKNGSLCNFGSANEWHGPIMESEDFEWRKYKEKWLPVKRKLEQDLKNA